MKTSERYRRVIEYFEKERPIANSELNYNNPFELLVAVILSAQCTDKRVNMITPPLFEAYPDAYAMAKASVEDIYGYIKSVSYPNNKSRHLSAMARTLVEMFDGVVPSDLDDLQKLQGVGRKTANVIASVIFNKPAMAVDTHVFRVANRIGLTTNSKTPLQTEQVLTKNIPEEKIPIAHHWLILHGRYVCIARNPKCHECGIAEVCRYFASKKKKDKQ